MNAYSYLEYNIHCLFCQGPQFFNYFGCLRRLIAAATLSSDIDVLINKN